MFKKLKNQLTFFNTVILVAFLIIFIVLIIVVIDWSLVTSSKYFLKTTAQTILSDEISESSNFITDNLYNDDYNFVIWNKDQGITQQSTNSSQIVEVVLELTNDNDITNDSYYTLSYNKNSYRFYSDFMNKSGSNILFVYQNLNFEKQILYYLILFLSIFGVIGVLALIPISRMLAGRSLKPIKQSYEDQKKFLADASHELRSPLTVIQTSVDVLSFKGSETIDENSKWVNNISNECQNMSKLITDMLDIAQEENKKLIFTDKKIVINPVIEEVIQLLTPTAKEKEIEIISQLSPNTLITVDSDRFKQLVRIFIDNAIKYSKNKSKIYVRLKQYKNKIVLEIQDNGIGISKKERKKIFERFYRTDEARTREEIGTGLGLNIAQSIVNNYNGKISLKSKPNKGSTFTITLPIK